MYGHRSDTNLSVVAGNLLLYGSFRFGHCFFSQIGSPTLLLASKHATFPCFRLTWTSSYVRVCRLGQPRDALNMRSCRYEAAKIEGSCFQSVANNSIIFQGPFQMK